MKLVTKDDLLEKLRTYSSTTDDDNIRYKEIIKTELLKCPELLYALDEKKFEEELFTKDGKINVDDNGQPLGQWEDFFGANSNIRPFINFPETQTNVNNYLCYQVGFDALPSSASSLKKYTEIIFTIFANGKDGIDKYTGIARHDLIASILREKFNWSSIFGMEAKLIYSRESLTDNTYLTRVLKFEIEDLNGISYTPFKEESYIRNNEYWTQNNT